MKKTLLALIALLLPLSAFAVQISVPSAPSSGYALVSTTTGAYIATTTDPFHVGSIYATSTSQTSTFNGALTIGGNTTLSALAGGGTLCLHVSNTGLVSTAAADCGSGGGNSFGYPFPSNATSTNITFSNGITLSNLTAGTVNSTGSGTLYTSATTTLAGTGVLSVSNSPYVFGSSPSVVSLTGGSAGQVLAWLSGIPTWTATTTFNSPLTYANGSVSCATCNTTNATVSSIATNNGITGGTITTTGTIGLATINAGVLGAVTNGSVPTSQATSTLYGTGTGGQVLAWNNGVPQWVATSSIQNITLTTTGSSGAATLIGNTLNIPQYTGGAGGSGGTWSTTTSSVSGQLVNYPNNNTDIVSVGSNSTTTSPFYIDPNYTAGPYLGIGTTTSTQTQVGIHLNANNTYVPYAFIIGSSTPSATTTLFAVDAGGGITTNLSGSGFVKTTGAGSKLTVDTNTYLTTAVTSIATNNGITGGTITTTGTIGLATINAGVLGAVTNGSVPTSQATSSLYGATGVGGTVLGWANGSLQFIATSSSGGTNYFTNSGANTYLSTGTKLGVGSSTPWGTLGVASANAASIVPLFTIGSSSSAVATSTLFIVNGNGNVGIGTSSPMSTLAINGDVNQYGGTGYVHYGLVPSDDTSYCTTGKLCFGYFGTDNTAAGVTYEVGNTSTGVNAYSGYDLTNSLAADGSGTHYAGIFLTGPNFNNTSFGTAYALSSQVQIDNQDGPILLGSASTTAAYVNIVLGGNNTGNETARFTTTGLGLGSTTPGSLLSVGGNATGWNFFDNATATKSGVGGLNIKQGCFAINGTCLGVINSLTTTGSSGAATFSNGILNIPQYSGGSSFSYPFPNQLGGGNATSSLTGFSGGILDTASSTFTGQTNFGGQIFSNNQLNIANNTNIEFGGGSGNVTDFKTGTDGTALFQTGTNQNLKFREGCDNSTCSVIFTNNAFNTNLFAVNGNGGNTTVLGNIVVSTTTEASTFPYASTTAISASNLTSGNCVQASTGGLLTTIASPCGSSLSGGTAGMLTSWVTSTTLTATGTPTFAAFTATSTTATSTIAGPLSYQGFVVATSTTICIYPETCQYQVAAGGGGAEVQFNAAYKYLFGLGGGTLYVKKGVYKPNAQINVATSTVTIGEGWNTQINVFSAGSSPAYYGFFVQDASNVVIENMHFDGANQNGQGGYDIRIKNDTANTTVSNVKIINNDFTNTFGFAVFPDSAVAGSVMTDVLIQGNHMDCRSAQDCIGGGPGVGNQTATTSNVTISNNIIIKTTAGGVNNSCIDPTAIINLNIIGNTCDGNIRLDNSQQPNQFVNITGNIVNPISDAKIAGGILIDDSSDSAQFTSKNITIANNTLNQSEIYVNGNSSAKTTQMSIHDNNITMPGAGYTVPFGNINYGIFLNNVDKSSVIGNTIATSSSAVSKGIFFTTTTNTRVSMNIIQGAGTGVDEGGGSGDETAMNQYSGNTKNENAIPNILTFIGGLFGVGTSSPFATISAFVGGDFLSHARSVAFAVGSSTAGTATSTLYEVDSAGHSVYSSQIQPTLSAGTFLYPANDSAGMITTVSGSGTTLTLTFANSWTYPPVCLATFATTTSAIAASTTATTMVLTYASVNNVRLSYNCVGTQ